MKKALRFLVIIGLILSMMSPLLSCSADDVQDLIDKNTGKLNPPTGIYLDSDNVLRWNSVDNASHYIVNIDEKEYTRSTVACDLKKILTVNGDYEVYVKATSDRTGIADSDYSEPVIIHYTGASDDTSDKETKLFGQFDDLFTAEAYIGYGYDVIGASYLNSREVKVNYPIFDHDKLMQQRLVKFNERDSQDEYISSNSVSSYQERVESKLNTKLKVKKAFSGSFGVKYQTTSETTASALFYEYRHSTVCYSLVLQCDFNDYRDMLTESFKRDLMTLDIGTLFERYGTHVITSAIMGGRFDLNYTMLSDKAIDTSKLSASIDTTLKAWVVDTSMDASVSIENQAKESNCTISSYSKVIGGDYIQLNNEKAILANYQKWLNTIEQKPALIGIRDINSLVPIWELLGDSEAEQERKAELQRVFEKYGQDSYDALLENYDVKPLTYPNSLTVTVKDSEHMPITGDIVYSGTTVYLDLQVEPEIAHIEKSIKVDKSDYVVLNTTNDSLFIKKDTPANTTLNITVDIGHGVSQVISLRVVPTYTVDFRCNGGLTTDGSVLSPQLNIPHGNTIDPPETITKSGYRFVGWFADQSYSTPFLFGETPITDNLTLYAKWEPITYKANFYIEKGNLYQTQTVAYNAAPTLPEEPTKVGHTFKGWFSDAECTQVFDFSAILTTDCNIYAKWTPNTYTVTFESNGGSEVAQQTVAYGEKVKRPATVKEGATLAGWYTDAACATLFDFSQDVVTGNMMLYAKWEVNTYTVTFETNGGTEVPEQTISYGNKVKRPTTEKVGSTFAGWFTDATCTILFDFTQDVVTKDMLLYAKWEINIYTVTFEPNGGSEVAQQAVAYGEKVKRPATVKEGSSFGGWFTDAACTELFDFAQNVVTGNLILYAKWTVNPVTVSFNCMGGEPVDDRITEHGSALGNTMPVPVRLGYTFAGWYTEQTGGTRFYATDAVTGSFTLYARWTANTYTVTLDGNGGTPSTAALTCVYGNAYGDLPDVSRTGYTFAGWYTEAGVLITPQSAVNIAGNHTLYARWTTVTYTVSYVNNGGENLSDGSYPTSYTAENPPVISAIQYATYPEYNHFLGWYEDAACTVPFSNDLNTNPRNITLYAKWDLCTVYYINNTPQNVTDKRVIVDWSSVPDGTFDCNRTIYTENISQIYFIGNPATIYQNLTISSFSGSAYNANILIHLSNFNMKGFLCNTENSVALQVTLDCTGENAIVAPTETSAIVGFASLTVTGDGNLNIKGGDGINATTAGGNGTDGAAAIIVDYVSIDMTGALTVVGGNGGNGATGSRGSNGRNADAVIGNAATDGKNGGRGGNGGAGASAIICAQINISVTGNINICGGNGGLGGDGGRGGDGGQPFYAWVSTSGGSGGAGGTGGPGASAVQCEVIAAGDNTTTTDGVSLGNGAKGAHGSGKHG